MVDDVVLNKCAAIERCVARVKEEYAGDPANLRNDLRRQDSILLNLQRACETAIDLAMHMVRVRKLGLPQESRDAFRLLGAANVIPQDLCDRLMRMVGFRNIAVHDYQRLDLDTVDAIIAHGLGDFLLFTRILLSQRSAS